MFGCFPELRRTQADTGAYVANIVLVLLNQPHPKFLCRAGARRDPTDLVDAIRLVDEVLHDRDLGLHLLCTDRLGIRVLEESEIASVAEDLFSGLAGEAGDAGEAFTLCLLPLDDVVDVDELLAGESLVPEYARFQFERPSDT